MIFSTRLNHKGRRIFRIDRFRGVDLENDRTKIDPSRASKMINLLPERGGLRKRRGFLQLHDDPSGYKINGIFPFKNAEKDVLIVHSGQSFWEIDRTSGTRIGMTVQPLPGNVRSFAFESDGRLYICGCGDIYVYGKFDSVYKIVRLTQRQELLYVPTTTINIDPKGAEVDVRAAFEGVNLLTPWRKNTLVGSAVQDLHVWFLDSPIDEEGTVTVEIDRPTTENEQLTEHVVLTRSEGGDGAFDDMSSAYGFVKRAEGAIALRVNTTPLIEGQDNITVTFRHTVAGSSVRVTSCRAAAVFGVGGDNRTLFLGGGNEKNLQFCSEPGNFGYFPDQNVTAIGAEENAIRAMLRVDDQTLMTVKDGKERFVFFQRGEWKNKYDAKGNLIDLWQVFPVTASAISSRVFSREACSLAGDSLIVCENGVYGLEMLSDVQLITRALKERSRLIKSALAAADLDSAAAIVFENRFFLSIGDAEGTVYVADASLFCYPDGTAGPRQYEWFVLKGVRAAVWAAVGSELWFGTVDGRLCKISNDSLDTTYEWVQGEQGDEKRYTRQDIPAQWSSAALDLGDELHAKTLTSMTVGISKSDEADASLSLQTENRKRTWRVLGLPHLNLGALDLSDLTLHSRFETSFTVRICERNFNYIVFSVTSDAGGPLQLNGLSAVYRTDRPLRGVK